MSSHSSSDDEGTEPFKISESLVAPPSDNKSASTSVISLSGLLVTPLHLKEDLKEGCGGQLWPAGMVLARYMLRYHRNDLKGKTILELGAGGGLVGLAVARGCSQPTASPAHIYITDQIPMLSLMWENIRLNDLPSTVTATVYDWGTPTPPELPNVFDIILAADCVYFEPAFPLLLDTLGTLLRNGTSICYFCFKKRRKADWRFIKGLKKGFDVREIDEDEERAVYGREGIYLYEIRKRRTTGS